MILIFSNKGDIHCNPVIEHLLDMNEPHLRVNTESLLTDYEVSFQVSPNGKSDLAIHCHRNGISASVRSAKSFWDRRPHRPRDVPSDDAGTAMHPEAKRVVLEEAAEFATWMRYMLEGVYSIGSPLGDQLGECKLHQFAVASRAREHASDPSHIGIPETVIANRKGAYTAFLKRHSVVAIKPIMADGVSMEEGVELPFLTQRLKSSDVASLPDEAFSATPTLMQPYIEKQCELRITTVGHQTFCCRIDSTAMDDDFGGVDWRAGYTSKSGIPQTAIETPPHLHDFCLAYLDELRLNFGCFDFIVDTEGKPWFLECNPNGQWMWIEEDIGLPISRAIAECLSRGANA